jgi:hypothetical protein
MEQLKSGGKKSLVLDAIALQRQKHDTLLRLHQAKKSVKVLMNSSTEQVGESMRIVVSINSSDALRGKSRMLSDSELQELINTKQIVSTETRHVIRRSHK